MAKHIKRDYSQAAQPTQPGKIPQMPTRPPMATMPSQVAKPAMVIGQSIDKKSWAIGGSILLLCILIALYFFVFKRRGTSGTTYFY